MRDVTMVSMGVIAWFVVLATSSTFAWGPRGYPWETYGEVTIANGVERGFKIDGWIKQGIDWMELGHGKWIVNTYVQPRLIFSDHSLHSREVQWWNQKASVYVGAEILNRDLLIWDRQWWGKIAFGIRGEFNYFLDGRHDPTLARDEMRGVLYLQWSAGGDLKKKQ